VKLLFRPHHGPSSNTCRKRTGNDFKISLLAASAIAPTTIGLSPSANSQSDSIRIPHTEPYVAQAALRGFQPFATDPAKQSRYNAYLQSQANQDSSVPSLKPTPGQRVDEFNKELEDYAKAALLFKPISGAMAGRFTSAVVFESGPKIHEGLHTPTPEELAEKEKEGQEERRG